LAAATPTTRNGAVARYARYAYWASKQETWRLLAILVPYAVSVRWTAMSLERVNSKAGIIVSRLRASMKPEMVERLVTGVDWARKSVGARNIFASLAEALRLRAGRVLDF
jgi:hypothetical protein